mmetsp:Transcript_24785/g.47545  ORF Transcript_24785/g.47545 Transcript_24785/m.47545 type:complete len:200 (-) Transcript_24785:611-1210(-)
MKWSSPVPQTPPQFWMLFSRLVAPCLDMTSIGPCRLLNRGQFFKKILSQPFPWPGMYNLRWFRSLTGNQTVSGSTLITQSCFDSFLLNWSAFQAVLKGIAFSGFVMAPLATCVEPMAQVGVSRVELIPLGILGKPRGPQRLSANFTSVMTAHSLQAKMPMPFSSCCLTSVSSIQPQLFSPTVCMMHQQNIDGHWRACSF